MGHGSDIRTFLYSQAIVVTFASLIGAVFLPAICALYNKLAGRRNATSVPEPTMGKAMGIMFITTLSNALLAGLISLVIAIGGRTARADHLNVGMQTQLISLPVCMLIMAGTLSWMLPTTFGRAFLITLLYLLVVVSVVGLVAGLMVQIVRWLNAEPYFRV